jgi:O-antigen/teichoic acid export membrane protein
LFVVLLPPLLLFSDVLLRLLYSGRFAAASTLVPLFVAAEVVTLLSGTYQALILADDRLTFHVLQNLAAQGLLVVTAAVALPRLGLAGAGVAAVMPPLLLFATTVIFLGRQFAVRVSREAWLMSAMTAAILVAGGTIGALYPGFSANVLGLKAVTCTLMWLIAYSLMPADDRAQLRIGARGLSRQVLARGQLGGSAV